MQIEKTGGLKPILRGIMAINCNEIILNLVHDNSVRQLMLVRLYVQCTAVGREGRVYTDVCICNVLAHVKITVRINLIILL